MFVELYIYWNQWYMASETLAADRKYLVLSYSVVILAGSQQVLTTKD